MCDLYTGYAIIPDFRTKVGVRLIHGCDLYASNYGILKINNLYWMMVLKFYYKLENKLLPSYFDEFIPKKSGGSTVYSIRNPQNILSISYIMCINCYHVSSVWGCVCMYLCMPTRFTQTKKNSHN